MMNLNRLSIFIVFLFGAFSFSFSQTASEIDNMRSDTINILNYDIHLDFLALTGNNIKASCKIDFASKMDDVDGISLDLLGLTVDSVKSNNALLNFTHNEALLRVSFPVIMNSNDLGEIEVFYHGTPVVDPSGFGGFYFNDGYAYNMGVGMTAEPHNYGRVWHPCFDNFVERATYEVTVVSAAGKTAYGNGYIANESVGPNNENIRTWKIDEEIPTYLACIGVGDYVEVNQNYTSELTGNVIPIVLASKASDTVKVKNSFLHLPEAIAAFEDGYGSYKWNKVGYTMVPFNGGAMEHATCIMYPLFAVNGTLEWETLMAHELSHHWWGNLVTCRTAEDMWINEGLAAFSESLFLEYLYGYENYLANLKKTHRNVIQRAHFNDGGFLPLSGIPHNATYGSHTYDKGAVQMHNLRTYLGDIDFFYGLRYIQNNFTHKDIDAAEFRDALTVATGKDMTAFFDNYIFNPGFNGFEIDSFVVTPQNDIYDVQVFIQQKVFEAPELFENVPIELSFIDEDWNSAVVETTVSGEFSTFNITLAYEPKAIVLNESSRLLNAVTGESIKATGTGVSQLNHANFHITIQAEEDSSFVRVEHYRLAPDPIVEEEMAEHFVISPDRYWKIDGVWSESFTAKGRVLFNAKNLAVGNLDNGLMIDHDGVAFTEDSLVLLWRPNQAVEWSLYDDFTVYPQGSTTDGAGRIEFGEIKKGEYAFGFKKKAGYSKLQGQIQKQLKVYPNPTKDVLNIDFGDLTVSKVKVLNGLGQEVESFAVENDKATLSTKILLSGTYQLMMYSKEEFVGKYTFIKD